MEVENCQVVKEGMESRDGIVVMVLASHLLDPFSATSGLSWFLVLYSAPKVSLRVLPPRFLSGFSGFPLSSKINISKF